MTLVALILGVAVFYVAYNFYARRIDRRVIEADPKKATPARLYMDGVDFVPTSRNVLFGYHFKSIAAAGPIVGAITAANLWGWLPSIVWLFVGVFFIGWAADYSAVMLGVRNEGNSLSAIAHRLIAPRTRMILLLFIFFYLLLVAGAFGSIMATVLNAQAPVAFAIVTLMVMGFLGGQMLYKWRTDLIIMTVVTVGVVLLATLLGPTAPVQDFFKGLNGAINGITGGQPLVSYFDPTAANPQTGQLVGATVNVMPSFVFWLLFIFLFCYLGAVLPIWRYTQPINYIGFWITAMTIVTGGLGAAVAVFLAPQFSSFNLPAFKSAMPVVGGAIQPIWPMLFVTIACGAISGWHSLIGSVGTSRQIEYETDALPVGGGSMLSEMLLGLLSLLAVTVIGKGGGAPAFAQGVGSFLSVFGIPVQYGTALAFAAFVIIVITVVQLVFRMMRVTLAEWLGDRAPIMRNIHVGTIVSMILTLLLVLSGTWIYLWQLFGAANQLLASLAMLVVTVWLVSAGRNPAYIGIPMLFMYVTTFVSILVTAYNLWVTVFTRHIAPGGNAVAAIGSGAMIIVALLLGVAALFIGYDGWQAYNRYRQRSLGAPVGAAATAGD